MSMVVSSIARASDNAAIFDPVIAVKGSGFKGVV